MIDGAVKPIQSVHMQSQVGAHACGAWDDADICVAKRSDDIAVCFQKYPLRCDLLPLTIIANIYDHTAMCTYLVGYSYHSINALICNFVNMSNYAKTVSSETSSL